jgi:hypothetical protein
MSLLFSKIRSVNVIISNMDGLYVMIGWTDYSSQKGHEPPMCKPIEKLSPLEYIYMEVEDAFEVEYSTEELVQLVQDGEHVFDSMEEDPLIVDSS